MAGLLGDVLPWVYSQGDRAKRYVGGLLSDPIGSLEQTAGQIQDYRREDQRLNAQAFANPQSPFQVTNKSALAQLADRTMAGPMGFAPMGMMAGVGAKTANLPNLEKAQALEKQGAKPEAIWQQTGWGKGPDGKWRFEIDDSAASIKTNPLNMMEISGQKYPDFKVGDALHHPALFDAYPSTANIQQSFSQGTGNHGEYKPGMDWISLDRRYQTPAYRPEDQAALDAAQRKLNEFYATPRYKRYNTLLDGIVDKHGFGERMDGVVDRFGVKGGLEQTLRGLVKEQRNAITGAVENATGASLSPAAKSIQLHELQHAIQQREGFAAGGDAARVGLDEYQRLAGEAEARLVQSRMNMTGQQRAAQYPWTEQYFQDATGVPLRSLIFR